MENSGIKLVVQDQRPDQAGGEELNGAWLRWKDFNDYFHGWVETTFLLWLLYGGECCDGKRLPILH